MIEKNSLVSVIIPVYNGEKYIAEALESIFNQDYRSFEIIVVDDGSTDETAQIIGKYDKVRYIYQSNQGVSSARNKGVAVSSGETIAFLDSDDYWPENRLTVIVRYLDRHPEVGYVLGKQMMFVESGCAVPAWVKVEWLTEPQDASNTGVLMMRRVTFDCVGFFNKDYQGGEDTEWLVRASELGVPMERLPDVVLHRRIHGENLSAHMIQMRKDNLIKISRELIRRKRKKIKSHYGKTK